MHPENLKLAQGPLILRVFPGRVPAQPLAVWRLNFAGNVANLEVSQIQCNVLGTAELAYITKSTDKHTNKQTTYQPSKQTSRQHTHKQINNKQKLDPTRTGRYQFLQGP